MIKMAKSGSQNGRKKEFFQNLYQVFLKKRGLLKK